MVGRHLIFLWQYYQKSQYPITGFMVVIVKAWNISFLIPFMRSMVCFWSQKQLGSFLIMETSYLLWLPRHGIFNCSDFLIMRRQHGSGDPRISISFPGFQFAAAGFWWFSCVVCLWESFLTAPNTVFLHPSQQFSKPINAY